MKQVVLRETAIFLGLLLFGLVILPVGIYLVGDKVFGSYAGHGFGDFFGALSSKFRIGEPVAWFLVLSPYIGVQIIRLTMLGWKLADGSKSASDAKPA